MLFLRRIAAAPLMAAPFLLAPACAAESILAGVNAVDQPTWTGPGDSWDFFWNMVSVGQAFTVPANAQNWKLDAFAFYFNWLQAPQMAGAYVYEWDNGSNKVIGSPIWSNPSISVTQAIPLGPPAAQFKIPVSPAVPVVAGKQYIAIMSKIYSGGVEQVTSSSFQAVSDAVYNGGNDVVYWSYETTLASMESTAWSANANSDNSKTTANLVSWFSFQTLQPYTVVIKTPKSPIALREQTTRALRFKVTNTGNAAIQGAAFTVAAPDALTLVSVKTVPPTWNAKHNKTVKAHEQTWTWPLDVQAKKSRTYTLRVKLACTAATTLALGTSVGATQGPIVTINVKDNPHKC